MRQTLALLAGALLLCGQALAGGQKWEQKVDSAVRFKLIHDSGLIVVGTTTTAYGFNPETGEQKWKIENLMKNYDPETVKPQPGSEYMVYIYKKGIMDVSPSVRCLNILTGEQVWESNLFEVLPDEMLPQLAKSFEIQFKPEDGAAFGMNTISAVVDDEANDQFLLCSYSAYLIAGKKMVFRGKTGINGKPVQMAAGVVAVERKTGKIKWVAPAPAQTGKVKVKATYFWSYPQQLGNKLLIDWAGVHVFDLKDGALVCAVPFDRTNGQGANAATVVDNGVAYVTSAGQLSAVDIATGQLKWQTKPDKKIVYSEIYAAGDKLVVKRGGTFSDAKGKPQVYAYGLDVLDKATGQPTFDSMTMHKSKDRQIADMTNVVVEGNTAYYATQKSLRAFDLDKLDYQYQAALGEDQGNLDGAKSVSSSGDGKIYVLMKQTTKAFNAADGAQLWSKTFEPPKVSALAMAMLNTLSAAAAQQRANSSITGRATYKVYSQASFYQGRATSTGEYNYVMAKENDKPTVVGVNLSTGADDRRATMDKKEADYIVDERFGILLNVEKGETLQVYDLNN